MRSHPLGNPGVLIDAFQGIDRALNDGRYKRSELRHIQWHWAVARVQGIGTYLRCFSATLSILRLGSYCSLGDLSDLLFNLWWQNALRLLT